MLPTPTARVFRSRRAALWWSFWVIVAAVLFVPWGSDAPPENAAVATDATGEVLRNADVEALAAVLNAN